METAARSNLEPMLAPSIVEAASQATPSQGEHYERSSPTLSATHVGKCGSRSRRPPGRPHDRRPRLFDGRAEAQCRRAGEGSESAEAADRRDVIRAELTLA